MLKLTDSERRVLWAAQHEADAPAARIARRARVQPRTVLRILQQLKERQVIFPLYVLNLSVLGLTEYDVYFGLQAMPGRKRKALLDFCIACDRVSLLREIGGDFEYAMTICARDPGGVSDVLDEMDERFGAVLLAKSIAIRHFYVGFGRKYLVNQPFSSHVEVYSSSPSYQMDKTDHLILKALSREHPETLAALSRSTGLPATTLDYRMRKLREKGVIVKVIYAVTPALFGMQRFRFSISGHARSRRFRSRLISYCARHPHVVHVTHSLGSWEYELGVEVPEQDGAPKLAEELQELLSEHQAELRVFPLFRYLKGYQYPYDHFRS